MNISKYIGWIKDNIIPDPPFLKVVNVENYNNWVDIVAWIHTTYPSRYKHYDPIDIKWPAYTKPGHSYEIIYLQLTFTSKESYSMFSIVWGSY